MFCSKCGTQNAAESSFCCKCGTRLLNPDAPHAGEHSSSISVGSIVSGIVGQISFVAGVERLEKASPREMFSEVFKKRTPDELEAYFSVGTAGTSPSLSQIKTRWPHPWAFVRTFIASIVAFIGLNCLAGNPTVFPAFLMVGAFAVPGSIMVLFFEFNVPRNISLFQLLRLSLLGGVIALVVCTMFSGGASNIGLDWMGDSIAGLTEEPAKLLAMLLVANNPRFRWTLNGLLIGACVGTGFAVVETAGYAFNSTITSGNVAQSWDTLLLRALSYPLGGHALLSSIVGAGLWRVKGERRFDWAMLKEPRFLRLFAISVVLHALWNTPVEWGWSPWKELCIGFVAWLIILSLVQAGLKEIRVAQTAAEAKPATSEAPIPEATVPSAAS